MEALLQQMHDDYLDVESGFKCIKEYYLEDMKKMLELGMKISTTFSWIMSGNVPWSDPETKDTIEAWRTKTAKLAKDLEGFKVEVLTRVIDLHTSIEDISILEHLMQSLFNEQENKARLKEQATMEDIDIEANDDASKHEHCMTRLVYDEI